MELGAPLRSGRPLGPVVKVVVAAAVGAVGAVGAKALGVVRPQKRVWAGPLGLNC